LDEGAPARRFGMTGNALMVFPVNSLDWGYCFLKYFIRKGKCHVPGSRDSAPEGEGYRRCPREDRRNSVDFAGLIWPHLMV
jgi:hypothetical protein